MFNFYFTFKILKGLLGIAVCLCVPHFVYGCFPHPILQKKRFIIPKFLDVIKFQLKFHKIKEFIIYFGRELISVSFEKYNILNFCCSCQPLWFNFNLTIWSTGNWNLYSWNSTLIMYVEKKSRYVDDENFVTKMHKYNFSKQWIFSKPVFFSLYLCY